MFSNREEAILAWNTRIETSENATLREHAKVLREALENMEGWDVQGLRLKDSYDDIHGPGSWDRLMAQTKPKDESPEKLARLIASDLEAIFGKGSIKCKYLDDPVAVERLRERLQTKPKDGE